MAYITHNREKVNEIIKKMSEAKAKGEKLEATLTSLSNKVQGNFAGLAKESLVPLLHAEIKRIQTEKENWQHLMEQAENVAKSLEEQDRTLLRSNMV